METIKVKINEDGITAKEINPLGEKPQQPFTGGLTAWLNSDEKWKKAESKLRTFEIGEAYGRKFPYIKLGIVFKHLIPNSIHTAEVLPNGKIKIID